MRMLLAPYARKLKVKKDNAKNYPWWPDVVSELKEKHGFKIYQVGVREEPLLDDIEGAILNKSFLELCEEVRNCDVWASVDSFFHHVATYVKKPGVVIWSQSDPDLFGDPMHHNILKNRKYLRPQQFQYWDQTEFDSKCFVHPGVVIEAILNMANKQDSQ